MKKFFISLSVAVVLPILSVSAVGVAGYRLDGTIDESFQSRSVPAKVTILDCGSGRMRQVTNYTTKCEVKQKGILRNTQTRKSQIIQGSLPRYRNSVKPPVEVKTTGEKSIEAQQAAYWRDIAKKKKETDERKARDEARAVEMERVETLYRIWWLENFKNMFE